MKKFYTTLVLVLIASLGFAQISTQTVKDDGNRLPVKKTTLNTAAKAGAGSWWYSYNEDLEQYLGEELEYGGSVFLQDSVASYEYSDGLGRPQFYSFVQIFDFTESIWYDFYDGLTDDLGTPIPVPHIGTTPTFTVDSMGCMYAYDRGTAVPANIVDTLVMTIIATSSMQYQTLTQASIPQFKQAILVYNIADATMAASTHPKFYQVKYPLTIDDTTGGYFSYKLLPVEGFTNIAHKTVAVSYSFKSGTPNRTLASVIGTDINKFVGYYNDEKRSDYNTNGTIALTTEKSNSMCGMEFSVADPGYFLYGKYVSNRIWINTPYKRPGILIHATCTDCAWVGVEETAQKNITVRPNPATSNFTLELVENTPAQVQIFNIVGQMVYNQTTSEATVNVNVNDLKAGIYMLRVTQNGQVYTSKVVVK